MPGSSRSETSTGLETSLTEIELIGSAQDTTLGLKLGVREEPFWRLHITPQGQLLTGDGFTPPGGALASASGSLLRDVTNIPGLSRCSPPMKNGSALSAGTMLGGTYRTRHEAMCDINNARLAWGNWTVVNGAETDGTNDITVRASIEYPVGTFNPVYFGGKRSVVIEPGGTVWCDPLGLFLAKEAVIFTRSFVSVATLGQKWPLSSTVSLFSNGEGNDQSSTAPPDLTTSGTVTALANQMLFSPFASECSTSVASPRVVAVLGDSIATGAGISGANTDTGFLETPLRLARIPHQRVAMGGSSATADSGVTGHRRRYPFVQSATHVICELGVNDRGQTLAQAQASLTSIWNYMVRKGAKVWQTTITPSTTSTDAWVTVGNQTQTNPGAIAAINDWIRTLPAPLTGYYEVADTVESSRNSGLWKANLTSDGIHPVLAGHDLMQAVINLDALK